MGMSDKKTTESQPETPPEIPPETPPTTNQSSLQQMVLRQRALPTLRDITENIFHGNWAIEMRRLRFHGQFVRERDQHGLRDGIINVVVPDRIENSEFAGVQDIHIHIFPTRYDGAGIRIGFGDGWRLDYESGEGRNGEIFIRSPDGIQHPDPGLSDRLTFPMLMVGIRSTLAGLNTGNQVPNGLLNITDSSLRDLIEYILFYLMTQVQQHRIRGGKKTRRKKLEKTRRKKFGKN